MRHGAPDRTVQTLKAQVVAKDGSQQTYLVTDEQSNPKSSGPIAAGDKLVVTAEDSTSRYVYALALFDPTAKAPATPSLAPRTDSAREPLIRATR